MMAGHCPNMEPVHRIKQWYKSIHGVGDFYYYFKIYST
jgi:hypothetical protein